MLRKGRDVVIPLIYKFVPFGGVPFCELSTGVDIQNTGVNVAGYAHLS